MATNPTGPDRVQQLLECCDPALCLGISRQAGRSMAGYSENQALAAIKLLAVRAENIEVATDALLAMKQDRDELVRSFATRVKGMAATCQLSEECPTCHANVSFSERMQRHVLIRGLADTQIRREMLQDNTEDKSLKRLIATVESKEAGNRAHSQSSSHDHSSIDASSYKQQGRGSLPPRPAPGNNASECYHCKGSHPSGRPDHCPAYGTSCSNCGIPHHFAKACSKPKSTGKKIPHKDSSSSSAVQEP